MTRSISLMAAIGALGLVVPVAGQAKQPSGNAGSTPSSVTAAAAPNPVVDGYSVAITGKLAAKTAAGVSVTLTAAPYPYTTFAPVANTMTDSVGVYHFAPSPKLNTEYRVMAKSKPPAISPTLLVYVRTRVAFGVSTSTPKIGARVRFTGSVTPAHNGQLVLIQRRRPNGTFVTVASTRLVRTITGAFSTYRATLRIKASGTYRVIKPHDVDHAAGFSRLRRITVHR